MDNSLEQALVNALTLIITACVPILVAFVVAWLKSLYNQEVAKLSLSQRNALDWAVHIAVSSAEQAGINEMVSDKKAYAIQVVQNLLASRGVKMDLESIDQAIEAAVYDDINFMKPTPAVPATPVVATPPPAA